MLEKITSLGNKKIFFASDFHLGVPDHESSLKREKNIIAWLESIKGEAHAIYLLGDIFDFVFEQNVMNMRLLMQHRRRDLPPRSSVEIAAAATFVVIVIVSFALLVTFGTIAGVIWLVGQRNA